MMYSGSREAGGQQRFFELRLQKSGKILRRFACALRKQNLIEQPRRFPRMMLNERIVAGGDRFWCSFCIDLQLLYRVTSNFFTMLASRLISLNRVLLCKKSEIGGVSILIDDLFPSFLLKATIYPQQTSSYLVPSR